MMRTPIEPKPTPPTHVKRAGAFPGDFTSKETAMFIFRRSLLSVLAALGVAALPLFLGL